VKLSFQTLYENFLLEYRHKTADGFIKPSIKPTNGKDPNRLNKKHIATKGPYKPKEKDLHKLNKIFMGKKLLTTLAEYNIDFEEGKVAAVKNSPYSLQMYLNKFGQPAAKVIKKPNE
jgi:hypothetical protein